jgi:RNA polymerase sigma-70 factor (ECF subfamily)
VSGPPTRAPLRPPPLYAERVTIGRPRAVSPDVNAVSTVVDARPALGEQPSFDDVAAAHLDAVYRYIVFLTGDRAAAEDLAAETFEKAFRTWRRFDPRRGSPRTWLCQIARTTALDWFRAEARRKRREETYSRDLEDAAELFDGLPGPLEQAVRELAPAEREVVALRVLLELDGPSAARVLGISQTACSTRLSRALKKLEERIDDVRD